MNTIRAAVVGCSRRGKNLADAILRNNDFTLVALCDLDKKALTAAGEHYGEDLHLKQNFSELARRDDIDAVLIATPQFTHCELAVEAFGNGKHVYCEKPLAVSIAECDRMLAAAKEAKRVFIVGQQMRYHMHLQKISSLLQAGEIGKPTMLWLRELRGPFRVSPEHMWMFDKTKSGGMLVEKSCHHFDMFNWFAGAKPVSVYASSGQDYFTEYAGMKSTIDDNAWVVVNYENGVRACLGLCMFLGRPLTTEGGIGLHNREIGVAGSGGLIVTEGALPHHVIEVRYSENKNATRIQLDDKGCVPTPFNQPGMVGIFMDFASCILEGRKPFAGGEIGRDALAVSLAAEKSSAENRLVEIAEICELEADYAV